MGSKFEENFWGDGNHGFEALLQNMRAGLVASKELSEYIKERIAVEDSYSKGLSKLHKSVQHVSGTTLGGFAPLWEVITEMSGRLGEIHVQLVKMLGELNKEILDYSNAQKDKLKTVMRGEIELAQESLQMLHSTDANLQRTKKQYQQSVDHLTKAIAKQKATADPSKAKAQLESRVNQAKTWMETMKSDHQTATKRHCEQVMDFQAKMKEASQKFESLEEEHLAQMTNFMLKITKTQDTHHIRSEQVFAKVNEQLNTMSVEFLLAEVVRTRGTGKDKPVPYTFKALVVPEAVSLSASTEDVRSSSPRTHSRGEKGLKGFLRKKKKKGDANGGPGAEGHQSVPESNVEVDEEGYSIRPEHASNIGMFPGDQGNSKADDWGSDSSEDEAENRIKKITIRETSGQPAATVNDIKASMKTLRLGGGSPGMRKATSSQSLNTFSTPPNAHRDISPVNSSHGNNTEASVASLMDIDLILSGGSQLQGIPSPLQPQAPLPPPLLGANPTETLTPWSLSDALREAEPSPPDTFVSLPASIPPLIPDSSPSTGPPVHPSASEPVLPKLLIPDKKPSPPPSQPNDLTPTPENASVTLEPSAKPPQPTPEEKPQESKVPDKDKDKGRVPPILPPPRRSNTVTPNRKNSNSSDLRVVSPLFVVTRAASESPTNVGRSPKTSVSPGSVIPLAVAFRETCNAIFHGADVKKCIHKASGEVVMSFPSNYFGSLASSEPLMFKLINSDSVERVLHNQQLLKKVEADQFQFTFDMTALLSQLKQMKEKHSSPFYNVQLLKYEVKLADSAQLPVKLVSYWKCQDSVTNFRVDCTYLSSSLNTTSGEAKPLTGVSISVPVDGGVRNALSKPTGSWDSEQSRMVWDLKTLSPAQEQATSLHAKFDITDGPSTPATATISFECDGATLSGLNFELSSSTYKISLLKFKCSSGKYTAEAS